MSGPLRALATVAALGAMTALATACGAMLGIDDVGYSSDGGDAGLVADSPNDASVVLPESGCGQGMKNCIVCVAERSAAHGCDPLSCDRCNVGPHAEAGCSGASCAIASCDKGYFDCDDASSNGCEIDSLSGDPRNCGACGASCEGGLLCQKGGGCASGCDGGTTECDGGCVDTKVDPRNCGACGNACVGVGSANAIVTCPGCTLECINGFVDCNGDPSDGCECEQSACVGGYCQHCAGFLQGQCKLNGCCLTVDGILPKCEISVDRPDGICCLDVGAPCGNPNGSWCCSGLCGASTGTCAAVGL